MVRNYKKKTSRGDWNKANMEAAMTEVKEGRMSCLGAANAYDIPEATLRRHIKTDAAVSQNYFSIK